MARRLSQVPGILAALGVMIAGFWLADIIGRAILDAQGLSGGGSPISGVPVAIVLGLLIRNAFGIPAALNPGLKFSVTTLLRLGIVLVGIRLSAFDVARLGLAGLPVVLAAVTAGLVFVTWFNRRVGLPPRLGTLVAAGTSICGVTAIVSTAPAIEADEREVAYAVANVVAFGLFGMLVYPYVAHLLLARSESVGLFLGTAIHDTSQVVGAALTYRQMYADDVVLRTWMHFRQSHESKHGERKAVSWTTLVPTFIIGFVVMAVVRTIGDATLQSNGAAFGVWDAATWTSLTNQIGDFWASRVLLGTAMAAVGLSTSFAVFKGVGAKPFVVGLVGALVVGAVGMVMAVVFGQFVAL
jgi:uncharacterized membrane protein YadS